MTRFVRVGVASECMRLVLSLSVPGVCLELLLNYYWPILMRTQEAGAVVREEREAIRPVRKYKLDPLSCEC